MKKSIQSVNPIKTLKILTKVTQYSNSNHMHRTEVKTLALRTSRQVIQHEFKTSNKMLRQ